MSRIARESPVPAYFQIALDLHKRIQRQEWKNGDQLPPEPELAKEYNVSRVTLRQALAELTKDGLLVRFQGKGTFINDIPKPIVHDLSLPLEFAGHLHKLGYHTTSRILEHKVFNDPLLNVIEHLKILSDQPVAYLKRLLLINNQPVAINRSWFSERLTPGISQQDLIDGSLSGTLSQRYHLVPIRSENWMEVVRAAEKEAYLLNTYHDTPIMLLTAVSYLSDDTPLEYSITSWLGDSIRFQYNIDLIDGESVIHAGRK